MQKSLIKSNLRSVISLVDKLRDINLESYIKLPKIVAVGSQSSGKSSLIQQIVGLDVLPRGSGVVTRRPLQIRMVYSVDKKQPEAVFEELPKQKFTDFNKVKETIEKLTDKVCGKNKNIVDKAIVMYIYSSNCPNLTVIDLPGLTRISLESQAENIHEVTKNMISKYMMQENTIILCVIPANQDITNDEVLHMARNIDTNGERTIGCITKIDIMDRGTDARSTLMNKGEVPLKLGYVGIKNRSQGDINEKKTVQESLDQEKMFFSKSPIYSSLPPACMGTSSLVDKLTKVLQNSITNYLPTLLQKIKEKKHTLSELVKSYGRPLPKSIEERQSLVWELCSLYINEYKNSIKGLVSVRNNAEKVHKISAHINNELREFLFEQFSSSLSEPLKDTKIQMALRKFDTINQLGFPSMNSFLFLITPLLNALKHPMQECLAKVCDHMTHLSDLISSDIAHEYIGFREYLNSVNAEIISEFRRKSHEYLECMLQVEIKGVGYQRLEFNFDRGNVSTQNMTKIQKSNPLIPVLRQSITRYYSNCVKNLRELIPKNIYYLIQNRAVEKLEFQIFQCCMSDPAQIEKWLELSSYSKQERLKNEHQFETIVKAEQYIMTHSGFSAARIEKVSKKRSEREKQLSDVMEKQKLKKAEKQKRANQQKQRDLSPIGKQDGAKRVDNTSAKTASNSKNMFGEPKGQSKGNKIQNTNNLKQDTSKTTQKTVETNIQPPKKKIFDQLFGSIDKDVKGTQSKQTGQKDSKQQNQSARKQIFGQNTAKKQTFKDEYNKQAGKATDKAVDQMFKNEQFQKQSKKALEKGASSAAQKQFGVSQDTGKLFGQGAGWVWGQQKTQNMVKEQSKKQAKNKTQM